MEDCKRLKNLPIGMRNMESLGTLKLSGCSELDYIQDLPRNLKELYLAGTAVNAFPSPLLENLSELVILSLENCKQLRNLPMGNSMKSLVTVKLSGCSELDDIQEFPQNLKELYIPCWHCHNELPSSIGDLADLVILDLKNCKKLRHLPMDMDNLNPLDVLDLSDCSQLDVVTKCLPEAKELHLAGTGKNFHLPKKFKLVSFTKIEVETTKLYTEKSNRHSTISGCVGCFYMGRHQGITKVGGPGGSTMPTAYPTAPQANQGYNAGAQPYPPNYAV
ncbi:hypothetical protein EUTSA_v10027343mg [Eutrema salsugineum]|uniref:Uncharacterized protein n=1 Tax=Eutrema salsugineum TaxID=72664 RepID=V4MJ47_EUTSA|nr:hypothetical protein EUTSA_v10027343mg [Eutrema salsugineum]